MKIDRIESSQRLSQALVHGNIVYLSGQVGTPGKSVTEQTQAILTSVDRLLQKSGTDKSKVLQAIIWLSDITDFAEMNDVWDKWVDGQNPPARATGETKLSNPEFKVEIIITAAV